MKNKIILLINGLFFLLLFYFFSYQVKVEQFKQLNFNFTVKLQDKIPAKFDYLLEDISIVISPFFSIIWIISITSILFIAVRNKAIYPGVLLIPFFFSLMIGAEIYGKSRVESPSPPFFMLKNPITMFPTYHVQDNYSYPSGHASRSLFLAVLVSYYFLRIKRKWLFTIVSSISVIGILLMGISKIYLGHHWLTDIIGGWIIAIAFLFFSFIFIKYSISLDKIVQRYKK